MRIVLVEQSIHISFVRLVSPFRKLPIAAAVAGDGEAVLVVLWQVFLIGVIFLGKLSCNIGRIPVL